MFGSQTKAQAKLQIFRHPGYVRPQALYLTVGQGGRIGAMPKWNCKMSSMAVQALWPGFLVREDWWLFSAIRQGWKFASLPRQGCRTGSMAGTATGRTAKPSSLDSLGH